MVELETSIKENKYMPKISSPFYLLSFLLLVALPSCSDEGTQSEENVVTLVFDDDGFSSDQSLEASSAEDVSEAVSDSVAFVDLEEWNRLPFEERKAAVLQGNFQPLGEFMKIFEGDSRTVKGEIVNSSMTVSPKFSELANSWGQDLSVAVEASTAQLNPEAVDLVWTEAFGLLALEQDDYQTAARAFAFLLEAMLEQGYGRDRIFELKPYIELLADHVSDFLPYELYEVQSGDSYWQICKAFNSDDKGLTLNWGWIADFNRKRGSSLRASEKLKIPVSVLSLRAWRGERLLVFYADGMPIRIYEASMGLKTEPTPLGKFTLAICEKNPVYYKQGASPVPYGNPDNPLGERWLGFAEDTQYGIHGTNSEETIGSYESGGCLRLHNSDVIELFDMVKSGVAVEILP
jgi:hypothetical protein